MVATYRVGGKGDVKKLAGAIASIIPHESVKLDCIGAGAVNIAVKAVSIARGYVVSSGIDLVIIPSFRNVVLDGEEKTGVSLLVVQR